nr:uncharacterized protein LOC117834515 [Setaria viridis]
MDSGAGTSADHAQHAPLPVCVRKGSKASRFCAEGTLTGARLRVPLPERETGSAGSVRCVGSFQGWLVGVKLNKGRYFGDLRCFLMKAFSRDVVRLPPPSAGARHVDAYSWSLPIVNGSGVVNCAINATQCVMSFCKVVLSTSPDSGFRCVAVGISIIKSAAKLAFWQSGMKSWCICDGDCITEFMDVVFCQGKLYMLSSSEFTIDLFAFEISEDNIGMIVSRVELFIFELPEVTDNYNETLA